MKNKSQVASEIGEFVLAARTKAGMTTADLCDLLQAKGWRTKIDEISRIERGHKMPSRKRLAAILESLGANMPSGIARYYQRTTPARKYVGGIRAVALMENSETRERIKTAREMLGAKTNVAAVVEAIDWVSRNKPPADKVVEMVRSEPTGDRALPWKLSADDDMALDEVMNHYRLITRSEAFRAALAIFCESHRA